MRPQEIAQAVCKPSSAVGIELFLTMAINTMVQRVVGSPTSDATLHAEYLTKQVEK